MARHEDARVSAARAELASAARRTAVPSPSAPHHWRFVALVADLGRRGWRLRRDAGPRGRATIEVEARGAA